MNLASVDFRRRLPKRKEYYWQRVAKGIYVGYRSSNATWHARIRRGDRTVKRFLAEADTFLNPNGETVLEYRDACSKAIELSKGDPDAPRSRLGYTVADAARDYLDYARARTKSHKKTENQIKTSILPELGKIPVEQLSAKRIEKWLNGIVNSKPQTRSRVVVDPTTKALKKIAQYRPVREDLDEHERKRRREATANRQLNTLKAMLNLAWTHGDITSLEFKKVKPFEGASKAVERFLTEAECRRLLAKLPQDFEQLVMGLLLTGARYSELRHARVRDFQPRQASLTVTRPKRRGSGTRSITLSQDAETFFREITDRRGGAEHIFLRADGKPWGDAHQARRMTKACELAKIDPPVGVHVLRHSVASHFLARGVGLKYIAEALGHSNIAITAKHYAHVEESHLRRELDRHGMRLVKSAKRGKVAHIK